MAFTHTLGRTYKTDAGTIASTTDTYSGNAENDLSVSVVGPVTNEEHDLQVAVGDIVSLVIYSDHAVTIKTNSTGSPGNTITTIGKVMIAWNTDSHEAKPLTTDVSKLFITNANTNTAKVDIRVLESV
jgi:hypothetical protein